MAEEGSGPSCGDADDLQFGPIQISGLRTKTKVESNQRGLGHSEKVVSASFRWCVCHGWHHGGVEVCPKSPAA